MAKKLKQFRLYDAPTLITNLDGEPVLDEDGKYTYDTTYCYRNSPQEATLDQWNTGEVFSAVYPIAQLGIQAIPGTKFYLNGSTRPIVVGASGIFDLDIKNGARVTGLGFSRQSLRNITESGTGYLLVDVLYGEED